MNLNVHICIDNLIPSNVQEVISSQMSDVMNSEKSCSYCRTTRTPLWRSGPSGPKSLCNACGIKYNKKRRALLGLDTGSKKQKRSGKGLMKQKRNEMGRSSLKLRWVTLGGGGMVIQTEQKRYGGGGELGEEEQAAILLMALSCGPLYA